LKKEAKNFCSTGFGLSTEAQPEFVKVFWFFFSKKNRFLYRLPSVEAISIPGQLRKKKQKTFVHFGRRPAGSRGPPPPADLRSAWATLQPRLVVRISACVIRHSGAHARLSIRRHTVTA
jgi:hypothetical protein